MSEHTFIQWKGTNVCMDIWGPECKERMHADTDFFYAFICPSCGATYRVGTEVALLKVTGEEEKDVRSWGS